MQEKRQKELWKMIKVSAMDWPMFPLRVLYSVSMCSAASQLVLASVSAAVCDRVNVQSKLQFLCHLISMHSLLFSVSGKTDVRVHICFEAALLPPQLYLSYV